jgi:hypothetical protein
VGVYRWRDLGVQGVYGPVMISLERTNAPPEKS